MDKFKFFDAEHKFLTIIWDMEPINSTVLSKVCLEKLGWKKPTTYNMIRKLSQRGVLKTEEAIITSLVKREEVQKYESKILVEKSFDGSLPTFLSAFLKNKKLTQEEALEIRKMIEEATK